MYRWHRQNKPLLVFYFITVRIDHKCHVKPTNCFRLPFPTISFTTFCKNTRLVYQLVKVALIMLKDFQHLDSLLKILLLKDLYTTECHLYFPDTIQLHTNVL